MQNWATNARHQQAHALNSKRGTFSGHCGGHSAGRVRFLAWTPTNTHKLPVGGRKSGSERREGGPLGPRGVGGNEGKGGVEVKRVRGPRLFKPKPTQCGGATTQPPPPRARLCSQVPGRVPHIHVGARQCGATRHKRRTSSRKLRCVTVGDVGVWGPAAPGAHAQPTESNVKKGMAAAAAPSGRRKRMHAAQSTPRVQQLCRRHWVACGPAPRGAGAPTGAWYGGKYPFTGGVGRCGAHGGPEGAEMAATTPTATGF